MAEGKSENSFFDSFRSPPTLSVPANAIHEWKYPTTSRLHVSDIGKNDVLWGRHKEAITHVGNRAYRDLVQTHFATYQSTKKREEKSSVVRKIISSIVQSGGRFLKQEKGTDTTWWRETSYRLAYDKVGHALRSAKATVGSRANAQYRPYSTVPQLPRPVMPVNSTVLPNEPQQVDLFNQLEKFLENHDTKVSWKKRGCTSSQVNEDQPIQEDFCAADPIVDGVTRCASLVCEPTVIADSTFSLIEWTIPQVGGGRPINGEEFCAPDPIVNWPNRCTSSAWEPTPIAEATSFLTDVFNFSEPLHPTFGLRQVSLSGEELDSHCLLSDDLFDF